METIGKPLNPKPVHRKRKKATFLNPKPQTLISCARFGTGLRSHGQAPSRINRNLDSFMKGVRSQCGARYERPRGEVAPPPVAGTARQGKAEVLPGNPKTKNCSVMNVAIFSVVRACSVTSRSQLGPLRDNHRSISVNQTN